jgi:sRNA-binding protein
MFNREQVIHVVKLLAERYPKCFFEYPHLRRPMKKNIIDDILNDGFPVDRGTLETALMWYKSNSDYKRQLVNGTTRIDLNGDEAGIVTGTYLEEKHKRQNTIRRERQERLKKALDILQQIESLCTAPHWHIQHKNRIVELVQEAMAEITQNLPSQD